MNIDDLIKKDKQDQPSFDVPSDLLCHMRDDTNFYRQLYYPTMAKCQDCYNKGDANKVMGFVLPMVDKGLSHYVKKYDLPYAENDLMTPDERKVLAQSIIDQETDGFKEGEY